MLIMKMFIGQKPKRHAQVRRHWHVPMYTVTFVHVWVYNYEYVKYIKTILLQQQHQNFTSWQFALNNDTKARQGFIQDLYIGGGVSCR